MRKVNVVGGGCRGQTPLLARKLAGAGACQFVKVKFLNLVTNLVMVSDSGLRSGLVLSLQHRAEQASNMDVPRPLLRQRSETLCGVAHGQT